MAIIQWVIGNKNWLLSGLGLFLIRLIYNYVTQKDFALAWADLAFIALILCLVVFIVEIFAVLKRKDFFVYFRTKIKEFFHLLLEDREIVIQGDEKYHCFALHTEHEKIINILKNFVCDNQGWLAQYPFIIGELHKQIKTELEKEKCGTQLDVNRLDAYIQELTDTLNAKQRIIFNGNIDKHVLEFFRDRSDLPPRVCIKGMKTNGQSLEVVDLFRPFAEYKTSYGIEENTGFHEVYKTGKNYLCNDIPNFARKDHYFNPRLDNDLVRTLYFDNSEKITDKEQDAKWQACWARNQVDEDTITLPSLPSCYKSTLIVPLTLCNNDLSDPFRAHFRINQVPDQEQMEKSIYGFLCFDHPTVDFFNEKTDVAAGYIFADILSLYMIFRLTFTEYSPSFQKAVDKVLQSRA